MISLTLLLLAQPSTLNLNQTPIVSRQNGGKLSNTRQYAIDCRSGMSCSVDGGVLLISSSGSTSAPVDATYLTQTANATLTNEQALSALGTGLMSNTTGTGVVSIYGGSACGANQYASSVNASGTLICAQVATSQLSGTITDGQLASSYSGVGACAANTFATTLSDNAAPTCSAVNDATGALKGGVVLAGDLAGTASLPSVVDDSHAHTGTTISALDTGDITTGTLGQARGGTGAGALTCSAGDFLTSNGTAYSCGTPTAGAPTGASYITRVAEAGLSSETAMGALGTGVSTSNATAAALQTVTIRRTTAAGSGGTTLAQEGTGTVGVSQMVPGTGNWTGRSVHTGTAGTAGALLDSWGWTVGEIGAGAADVPGQQMQCKKYGQNGEQMPYVASGTANGVTIAVTAAGAGGLASGAIAVTFIAE